MNIPQYYHSIILRIGEVTGLPDSVLHIHAGLAILLVARVVSGRALGTFVPFAFVVAAEAGNEILDYLAAGGWSADVYADIWYTLFWPFLISLAVRMRPMSRRRRRTAVAA
ncbi:MAG: hypothetical protein WCY29_13965 [Novosphingobium sp.]